MEYNYEQLLPGNLRSQDFHDISDLIDTLSPGKQIMGLGYLYEILRGSHVIVARVILDNEEERQPIVGMVTFHFKCLFTGVRGYIDDLTVHPDHERHGLGGGLMDLAHTEARLQNVTTMNLTSSSHREGAISLYKKLGYKTRDTNVFRLTL